MVFDDKLDAVSAMANLWQVLQFFDDTKATRQVRESVLRKFAASHEDDYRAWQALLSALVDNENWPELVRLANQTALRFPSEPAPAFLAATGLANMLKIKQALARIAQDGGRIRGPAEACLAGELLLAIDPAAAARMFERILKEQPADTTAGQGLASAVSVLNGRAGAEVVFFQASAWHATIQQSVFDTLSAMGIGTVMTSKVWLLHALRPRIVVLSDVPTDLIKRIRHSIPDARIVNTRHGLGDKNYAYYASAIVDYVCVSSACVARHQASAGCLDPAKFWVTGFPQMDPLFRMIESTGAGRLDSSRRILFAPTFTNHLNAGELIGNDPVATLRGGESGWHITIRPHPHMQFTHPGLLSAWQQSVAESENAVMDMDFSRSPAELLHRTDVMVSDVSSLALQFLALDRPIVCLMDDAAAQCSPYFAHESYEARLAGAALRPDSRREIAGAVRLSLEGNQPDSIVRLRRALCDELFGGLRDGQAGRRIAAKIHNILNSQNASA